MPDIIKLSYFGSDTVSFCVCFFFTVIVQEEELSNSDEFVSKIINLNLFVFSLSFFLYIHCHSNYKYYEVTILQLVECHKSLCYVGFIYTPWLVGCANSTQNQRHHVVGANF